MLSPLCEAAHAGAWIQCAAHVAAVTGESLNGVANPVFQKVHKALADLKDNYEVDALQAPNMAHRGLGPPRSQTMRTSAC